MPLGPTGLLPAPEGPTREYVYSALFASLVAQHAALPVPLFAKMTRRMVLPTMLTPQQQPTLILRQWHERFEYQQQLVVRRWPCFIYVFAKNPVPDQSIPGSAIDMPAGELMLNPLKEFVADAIDPPPGFVENELWDSSGVGHVSHVRITDVITESGDTDPDGQAFAMFEVSILVP